jgi:D-3-phosphoglycerate dehydrogenase
MISQTGKLAGHVDVAAATELGIAIAEGVGSPTAPAELTWALIMAAARKIVPYATNLKDGLWQTASVNRSSTGWAWCSKAARWASGATARSASWWPAMAARSACRCWSGAAKQPRKAVADGYQAAASRARCSNRPMC